jgi:hypothetical protein
VDSSFASNRAADVEDFNDASDLPAEEKSALWLLAWSCVHPQAQRREADAHLTRLKGSPPPAPVNHAPTPPRRRIATDRATATHPSQRPAGTDHPFGVMRPRGRPGLIDYSNRRRSSMSTLPESTTRKRRSARFSGRRRVRSPLIERIVMPGLLRGAARVAVVAGTATAVSNRVSRRQANRWEGQEQGQEPEPAPVAEQPAAPPADPIALLKQLAALKDQGILTEDEFAAEKAKVLAG